MTGKQLDPTKSLEESLMPGGRLSADGEAAIRGAAQTGRAPTLRVLLLEIDALRSELAAAEEKLKRQRRTEREEGTA